MATTVTYKGETLTTVRNTTKTLKTGGKWVEGDIGITDETSTAVVAVEDVPDSHGGIEKRITAVDISDTDATASDVAQGKVFYSNTGTRTTGTATIGGYSMDEIIAHEYSGDVETDATSLYSGTFQASEITSFTAPNITSLSNNLYYLFTDSTSLTEVSFPNLTIMQNYVIQTFKGCTSLTTISMPKLATIRNHCEYVWENCRSLQSISFPLLVTVSSWADGLWQGCSALTDVYLPLVAELGSNEFRYCSSLEKVALPKCGMLYSSVFSACTKLQEFDFLGATSGNGIREFNFSNCPVLTVMVIRNTAGVCPLGNVNNFNDTPFASNGTGGTLYVPSALISNYQSASNWSTILGYANNQILPIEGSYYEAHYADGSEVTA